MVLSIGDLIQSVRGRGGKFLVDGGRLGVSPPTAAEPFARQIREHKREIVDALKGEIIEAFRAGELLAVPVGVRIIRWEPKAAPVQLSQCATVTDIQKFISTTLRQLDAKLNGKSWQSGNWPLSALLERLAACGCIVALDDPKRALQ